MLRLLVILLLLANVAYWAWSEGWAADYGWAPSQPRESFRLDQQVRPQALRVISAEEMRRLDAAAPQPKPPECLQAGLFNAAQAQTWRAALETQLSGGGWEIAEGVETGRWLIYMGPYASLDILNRKKAELRYRNVPFDAPRKPELEPGLSLGSFDSAEAAQQALIQLGTRGVRTARVLQDRPEVRGFWVRLSQVDEPLRARLDEWKPLLDGRAWRVCR